MDEEQEAGQRQLERLRFSHAQSVELLRATTAFEHAALRPPMLLNGGALVVFLALFGSVKTGASTIQGFDDTWTVVAIGIWILGLLVASAGTALGYYSQLAFYKERGRRIDAERERDQENLEEAGKKEAEAKCQGDKGQRHRRRAELCWFLSVASFILGVFAAIGATGLIS